MVLSYSWDTQTFLRSLVDTAPTSHGLTGSHMGPNELP